MTKKTYINTNPPYQSIPLRKKTTRLLFSITAFFLSQFKIKNQIISIITTTYCPFTVELSPSFAPKSLLDPSLSDDFYFSFHVIQTREKTKNLPKHLQFNQRNFENAQNLTLDLLVYKSTY